MRKIVWLMLLGVFVLLVYKNCVQQQDFIVPESILASQHGKQPPPLHAAPNSQKQPSYEVRELEPYQGQFRILSRKNYSSGREAQFSPIDLAVGWGDMARPEIYQQIDIKQRNRSYYWHTDAAPIPLAQIAAQSANMHIVPANADIARQLQQIRQHDLVYLKGALIEIQSSDGWRWRSSLLRTDTGQGACELMRVDEIRW